MFDFILDLFIQIFRYILWLIVSLIMTLTNVILEVFQILSSIDIFQSYPFIWNIYFGFMSVVLSTFIFYKVVKLYFKSLSDSKGDGSFYLRFDVIIKKIFVIMLIVGLIPLFLKTYATFSAELSSKLPKILGFDSKLNIQQMFCSINKVGCPAIDNTNIFSGQINYKENGVYYYFPNILDLIILTVASWMVLRILIIVCIGVVNRFLGIIFRLPLAPYVMASYIEDDGNKLKTWVSLNFSDLSINFIQVLMVLLSINFINTIFSNGFISFINISPLTHFIVKIFIIIGTLMAIVNAPGSIQQFIGSDASSTSSLQQAGFTNSLIKEGLANVKTAGAGAAVGTGFANKGMNFISNKTIGKNFLPAIGGVIASKTGLNKVGDFISNKINTNPNSNFAKFSNQAINASKYLGRNLKNGINQIGRSGFNMGKNHLKSRMGKYGIFNRR